MLNWSHVETLNGVMVVDKPGGWTSHDVVNKARRFAGTRKVGHLGTLDPMATGVLPLLIGRATRLAQFFGKADKVYEGTIHSATRRIPMTPKASRPRESQPSVSTPPE